MRKDRMQWKIPKINWAEILEKIVKIIIKTCLIIIGIAIVAMIVFSYYAIWAFIDIKDCNVLLEIFIKVVFTAMLTLFVVGMGALMASDL